MQSHEGFLRKWAIHTIKKWEERKKTKESKEVKRKNICNDNVVNRLPRCLSPPMASVQVENRHETPQNPEKINQIYRESGCASPAMKGREAYLQSSLFNKRRDVIIHPPRRTSLLSPRVGIHESLKVKIKHTIENKQYATMPYTHRGGQKQNRCLRRRTKSFRGRRAKRVAPQASSARRHTCHKQIYSTSTTPR